MGAYSGRGWLEYWDAVLRVYVERNYHRVAIGWDVAYPDAWAALAELDRLHKARA